MSNLINCSTIQVNYFKEIFTKLGYKFKEEGSFNLNLIGIRQETGNNSFDDFMYVIYKDAKSRWIVQQFAITTDAGSYYLANPMNSNGTAIMVPGQYVDAYKVGVHKTYPALQQAKSIKVYRDNNKDTIHDLDPKTIQEGLFGINIHHATFEGASTKVDKWSAGCMVFSNILEWNLFFYLVSVAQKVHGDYFTFTLLDENQLK